MKNPYPGLFRKPRNDSHYMVALDEFRNPCGVSEMLSLSEIREYAYDFMCLCHGYCVQIFFVGTHKRTGQIEEYHAGEGRPNGFV